ncbi:MAG: hypothetical protein AAGI52_06430 [Bacteroidota bacterium]
MRVSPIPSRGIVTEDQKKAVLSALVIVDMSQGAWAKNEGLHRSEVSRMLNGKLETRPNYAAALNRLLRRAHPVQVKSNPSSRVAA